MPKVSKNKRNKSKLATFTYTEKKLNLTPAFPEIAKREDNKVEFLFFTRNRDREIKEHSFELLPASYSNERKLLDNGQLTPWSSGTDPIYTPLMLSSLVIYLDANKKQMEMIQVILNEFGGFISQSSNNIDNFKISINLGRLKYFYLKTINSNNEYIAFTNLQIESSLENITLSFWNFSSYTQTIDDIKKEYTAAPF